jgi:peptide/nickel transport system ATP-binding protein
LGEPLLEVKDLHVQFVVREGIVHAVNGISFSVEKGKVLAFLGESGCGKTVTLRAIARLLPGRRARVSGDVSLNGRNLYELPEQDMQNIRGRLISMVFQEPMTALDPVYTVGGQIVEALLRHQGMSREAATRRALELLEVVQIPSPERRLKSYPHEMSGGMRQRAMIAMALACGPELLLADEPTTSLDVTVQAQVLYLLKDLQQQIGMALILVSHDLGVVAEVADDVVVMYAGRIVEHGPVREVFKNPTHPYTEGLIKSTVRRGGRGEKLVAIQGQPPDLLGLPRGCSFAPRCPYVHDRCLEKFPPTYSVSRVHTARCYRLEEE